jgi:hypothetical protein
MSTYYEIDLGDIKKEDFPISLAYAIATDSDITPAQLLEIAEYIKTYANHRMEIAIGVHNNE